MATTGINFDSTVQQDPGLSVVIATLGGPTLRSTVEALNAGSFVPTEILICIPDGDSSKVNDLEFANVKIFPTNFRGQVPQRIYGFERCGCAMVMQLDDDLLVDELCLQRLVNTGLALGPNVAVAPALVNKKTGSSVYTKPRRNGFVASVYYWLMNGWEGYVPGRIDKSGSSVGIDPFISTASLHDVEWLAGGCVLHRKENLVVENFWLLPGKAYYEDVVHSSLLRAKGVRLVIEPSAICALEIFDQTSFSSKEFFLNLYRDYLGRTYFLRKFSRWSPRIYFYYLGRIASYLLAKR